MTIKKTGIPLFQGIDMTTRKLPMLVADSGKPGPVIWLTAAIHGDEVTGIAVVQSVFQRLEYYGLKQGIVYAFPVLNPLGFEMASRSEPFSEDDLNRNFGGDEDGTPSERQAFLIQKTILKTGPDLVIDLHTDSMNSVAYSIVDMFNEPDPGRETRTALARDLGFAWAYDTTESAGYEVKTSLAGYLAAQGVPAVTVELGGPMVVIEEFRKRGMDAVWNVLFNRQMVEQPPNDYDAIDQRESFVFFERVRTQSTGLIDYRVRPGDVIRKGKILGKIRNVFGETIETIRSPETCVVFSHEDQSVVFPGQDLFTLARKSVEGVE